MKKLLTFALLLIAAGWIYTKTSAPYPPLKDGDIVFQTTLDNQSLAIATATASYYTHTGIVKLSGNIAYVVEAVGPVKETPFNEWIKRGLFKRIAVYRDPALTPDAASRVLAAAQIYYGRPYNIFFSFKNNGIYCSELVYLAYKEAGSPVGKTEKVSELYANNSFVKKLIERRWQLDPECTSQHFDFRQCYSYILDQELITPASIARDSKLQRIYSNYPF